VAGVTPQQLLSGVGQADLLMIAEGEDVPEEVAEASEANLAIADVAPDKPFTFYRLIYRPGDVRQVDVERWSAIEEIRGEIDELLEDLEAEHHPLLETIRRHLAGVVDIVDASFGSSPGEAMAPILASETARWLAEHFDGIVRAADDSWWQLGSAGEYAELAP
jgi:hypothetical protein